MSTPALSVIIPVLNEARHLPALLTDIKSQEEVSLEVIIGDGGSTDDSRQIAESHGAMFVSGQRGRGAQMNAAADNANGDYLLFLHADSRLEDSRLLANAVLALRDKIAETGHPDTAGHFPLRFIRTSSKNSMAYRYMEEKTAFNRPNTTNGDQGFLMTRDFFSRLGGFDTRLAFLEDQQLAEKIRQRGAWVTLPGLLHTSARRFETEGFHRRYLLMAIIMGLHSTGVKIFFERTPHLYRAQKETGKLLLTPFFRILWEIMREDLGLWGSVRAWFYVGRYVRQNSWQMFYFFDVLGRPLLGPGRYPCLAIHDKVIGPLTNFRIVDGITALLCFIWIMGILGTYYRFREYGETE